MSVEDKVRRINSVCVNVWSYYAHMDVDESDGEENPVTLYYASLRGVEMEYGEEGKRINENDIPDIIAACMYKMPQPNVTLSDTLDGIGSPLSWSHIAYASLLATIVESAREVLEGDGIDVKLKDAERIRMCENF